MKKLFYTSLMVAIALASFASCGTKKVDAIKVLSTEYSATYGTYDWYLKIAGEESYISTIATDCDTLFKVAMTVDVELTEKIKMPKNIIPEYKDATVFMYGAYEIGDMKLSAEDMVEFTDFLTGSAGDETTLTFVSKDSFSMSEIEKEIENVDNFEIRGLRFTEKGKVFPKELFECFFGDAELDEVIDDFEVMSLELKKSLNEYIDNESSEEYEVLNELYREAEIFSAKLEMSIDEDNLTRSQTMRITDIVEIMELVYDEI